jgi:hypothetical protein
MDADNLDDKHHLACLLAELLGLVLNLFAHNETSLE